MSGPETSERHHGPFRAGTVPLSPARMLCPRGDSNRSPISSAAPRSPGWASDEWLLARQVSGPADRRSRSPAALLAGALADLYVSRSNRRSR